MDEFEDEDEEVVEKPFWRCQECGYEDKKKPMPMDRNKFYKRPESPICPKCKSIGFVPVGW